MEEGQTWDLANAAMALILLSASEKKIPNRISVMSAKINEMKNQKIDMGNLSVSKVAGGFYSEPLDRFIGSFLIAGDAIKRSPLELKSNGIKICKDIVQDICLKDRNKLESIANAVNIDLNLYCPTI
jgi:hypothetical protein